MDKVKESQSLLDGGDFLASISDIIEQFIKDMLKDTPGGAIDLQRNEMADYFKCAPSQINYVLSTRFTLERGYYIESRRGGGGYIRIRRLKIDKDDYILHILNNRIGNSISEPQGHAIVENMAEQELITHREAEIMKSAISDDAMAVPLAGKGIFRANVLKAMLKRILIL